MNEEIAANVTGAAVVGTGDNSQGVTWKPRNSNGRNMIGGGVNTRAGIMKPNEKKKKLSDIVKTNTLKSLTPLAKMKPAFKSLKKTL